MQEMVPASPQRDASAPLRRSAPPHPSAPMDVNRKSTPHRNASCISCGRQTFFGSEMTDTAVRLLGGGRRRGWREGARVSAEGVGSSTE